MIEQFLKYLSAEQGLARLTVEAYGNDLRQWERFMRAQRGDGAFEPASYATADLRLWVAYLSSEGISAVSIRRKASAVKAFYRYLLRRGVIAVNPASDLTLPKAAKTLPVFVRPEETASMLDEEIDEDDFDQVRDRLVMLMLYTTGLRCSELIGLLDVNVDTARGELKARGKRNKDRIVPFGQEMKELIDRYRALRARDADDAGAPEFFVRRCGKPMYRKAVYNIAHNAMTLAGVHAARLSPHVMRHSFATDMLNDGAQLSTVSSLMGHASLASTQVYTHITYRELKQNYLTAHPRAQKKGENHGSKN